MGPDDAVHPSDRRRPPPRERSPFGRRPRLVLAAVVGTALGAAIVAVGGAGGAFLLVWVLAWAGPLGIALYRWWMGRRFDPSADRPDPSSGDGWFSAGRVDDEGLVLPGLPPRRTCDLTLGPEGVVLTAGWTSAALPWGDHRAGPVAPVSRAAGGRAGVGTGWWLTAWASGGNSGPSGVAVAVSGEDVERTARVRALRSSWRNRFTRLDAPDVAVPLVISSMLEPRIDAERGIVALLCQVVAARPELWERLAERTRVERLLADMRRRPLPAVADSDPISRRSLEVVLSLRRLGYTHALGGRPLPDEVLPPLDQVVSRVLADLRRNPFSRDLGIGEGQVRAAVRQRYLVEPWPFGALMSRAIDHPGRPA